MVNNLLFTILICMLLCIHCLCNLLLLILQIVTAQHFFFKVLNKGRVNASLKRGVNVGNMVGGGGALAVRSFGVKLLLFYLDHLRLASRIAAYFHQDVDTIPILQFSHY